MKYTIWSISYWGSKYLLRGNSKVENCKKMVVFTLFSEIDLVWWSCFGTFILIRLDFKPVLRLKNEVKCTAHIFSCGSPITNIFLY